MKNGKYFPIESDGKFTLMLFQPAYYSMSCSDNAYIRNIKTGENYGQELVLCKFVNNADGTVNENPELEEKGEYEVVPL
jgi:hypothetical protein